MPRNPLHQIIGHLFAPYGLADREGPAAYTAGSAAGRGTMPVDFRGAFLRKTDLSFANLERANLSGADFSNAIFTGANFKNANLEGTVLKGADLTDARNLTRAQIASAVVDEHTRLPNWLRPGDAGAGM